MFVNLLATACLSSSASDNVVARSASEMPAWAKGTEYPDASRWVFGRFWKTGVYRLDLGIRQTQAEARESGKPLILERVRKEYLDLINEKVQPLDRTYVSQSVEAALTKMAGGFEPPFAEPVETYYEEVREERDGRPSTRFDIYVLVRMERQAFDEGVAQVADILVQHPDGRVRALGEAMRNLGDEPQTPPEGGAPETAEPDIENQ